MNDDLKKNASGCNDLTAYEAIKNIDEEDDRFHKLLNTLFIFSSNDVFVLFNPFFNLSKNPIFFSYLFIFFIFL